LARRRGPILRRIAISTDLITLFDRPQTVDASYLLEQVDGAIDFEPVIERFRHRWTPQVWERRIAPGSGHEELRGPGGFAFDFEDGLLEVYHLIPFSHFAHDEQIRTELRRAWFFVARAIGSSRAIYTHELMSYRGTSLAAIESGLRGRIGPPAESFAELLAAEPFQARAWYIDDFSDLGASGP
jgi:hypothetical protein